MVKKLDDTAITNELKGASAFFARPKAQEMHDAIQDTMPMINETNDRTNEPNGSSERSAAAQTDTVTGKSSTPELGFMDELHAAEEDTGRERTTKRYSFEIFEDQIELLDELKYLYRRKSGHKLATSKILRDLIDERLPGILRQLKGNQHQVHEGSNAPENGSRLPSQP
ncbi:MAG: hypothetical protein KDE20_00285 [Caldilineaceae bacterium]|nr:hypothetical protein [Caldilineaceae bacterium]MCB9140503.1 hypothetical protein [Caldilineaceae bacterium]